MPTRWFPERSSTVIVVFVMDPPPHTPSQKWREEPVCELVSLRTYSALPGYIYVVLINASVELFLLHF